MLDLHIRLGWPASYISNYFQLRFSCIEQQNRGCRHVFCTAQKKWPVYSHVFTTSTVLKIVFSNATTEDIELEEMSGIIKVVIFAGDVRDLE